MLQVGVIAGLLVPMALGCWGLRISSSLLCDRLVRARRQQLREVHASYP